MNSKYLLSIPFTTDKHSGILIKKEDDLQFNIGENYIKLNYDETRRKGSFEVINQDKPSLIDFYNNLKNVINTMSLYNSQYTNWNIKLESYDENEITEKIIELKPTKITKDGNQWEITPHLNFNIEMELTEAIASITVSSIIEDIKNIYNQIDKNCQIKNKTTILDIYKILFSRKNLHVF